MEGLTTHKESTIGRIVTRTGGMRPVYLASMETTDPHVWALAEAIFWADQLREHSAFMEMLLPVEHLPAQHEQAAMYKGAFETLFEKATKTELEPDRIRDVSFDYIGQADALIEFQRRLLDEQSAGKIHSLMWPTFLEHLTHEAERSSERQRKYMAGEAVQTDRDEAIEHWAQIMAEHSQFIAHMLDPKERDLFNQVSQTGDRFWGIRKEHALQENMDPVLPEIDRIIEFKTTALDGIQAGKIRSIIPPALADHVRREAIVFGEELRRADAQAGIQPMAA